MSVCNHTSDHKYDHRLAADDIAISITISVDCCQGCDWTIWIQVLFLIGSANYLSS